MQASTCIPTHLQASASIYKHLQASTSIYKHLQASASIYNYLQASASITKSSSPGIPCEKIRIVLQIFNKSAPDLHRFSSGADLEQNLQICSRILLQNCSRSAPSRSEL